MLIFCVYFNTRKLKKMGEFMSKSYMSTYLYRIKLECSRGLIILRIKTDFYRWLYYNNQVRFSKSKGINTNFLNARPLTVSRFYSRTKNCLTFKSKQKPHCSSYFWLPLHFSFSLSFSSLSFLTPPLNFIAWKVMGP